MAGSATSNTVSKRPLYHFETAFRFKPDFAAARFKYGVALAKVNRFDEAQRQIEMALKFNPVP